MLKSQEGITAMMVITIVTQVSCGSLLTPRSKSVFSVDESNAECMSLINESYWSLETVFKMGMYNLI